MMLFYPPRFFVKRFLKSLQFVHNFAMNIYLVPSSHYLLFRCIYIPCRPSIYCFDAFTFHAVSAFILSIRLYLCRPHCRNIRRDATCGVRLHLKQYHNPKIDKSCVSCRFNIIVPMTLSSNTAYSVLH